jgi:hypothetical protein
MVSIHLKHDVAFGEMAKKVAAPAPESVILGRMGLSLSHPV